MADEKGLRLLFWIGTTVMLLLTFTVVLIAVLYQRRVYRLRQQEARKLMSAALKAEHNERKRLAAGLHDGICGDINAIRNFASMLHKDEERNQEIIEEIRLALDHTLNNVREFSHNLMPPLLQTSGLVVALKEYTKKIAQSYRIVVEGKWPHEVVALSETQAYELYLVVQELITNAIKHGDAEHIKLSIHMHGDIVEMDVEDNGRTYNFFQSLKTSSGLGLRNIISRLSGIDAQLQQLSSVLGNKLRISLHK